MPDLVSRLTFMAQTAANPDAPWSTWPFSGAGDQGIWFEAARVALILIIFGAISLFLRFLFGPKGLWRDKEVDAEYEARRRQELARLDELLREGRLTKDEYEWRKKQL